MDGRVQSESLGDDSVCEIEVCDVFRCRWFISQNSVEFVVEHLPNIRIHRQRVPGESERRGGGFVPSKDHREHLVFDFLRAQMVLATCFACLVELR